MSEDNLRNRTPSPYLLPTGEGFVSAAAKLAGLAGALLGWRPDEFWNATPAELATVIAALAGASIRGGIGAILGGGKAGGLGETIASLLAAFAGAPGKAIGGPVSPARPYLVGERGPELFVPTASGRIEALPGGRDIRLSITINAPAGSEARALQASSRQVARAVRRALSEAG